MLTNKKIIVAGAGGLLGLQIVAALLAHNARVIALDIDYNQLQQRIAQAGIANTRLNLEPLDLNDATAVIAFFEQLYACDGAVNCTYPRNTMYGTSFFNVKLADFNANLTLHLGAFFIFSQQCAAYFIKNKHPFSLVNLASIYGVIAPKFSLYTNTTMTMPVEYAAIKAAIIHLNKYIASYIAHSDFRINSVSPGGIYANQPQSFISAYKERTFGKGLLESQDIIGAILFLLSDHSKYINAQNLVIDDGFCL